MKGRTHQVASLALSALALDSLGQNLTVPFALGIMIGAKLPDVDNFSPKREDPVIGHRGIMHSFVPVILLLMGISFVQSQFALITYIGLTIGYFLHILEDCLTPMGCPILYPFSKKKISAKLIKYDGIGEYLIYVFSIILIALIVVKQNPIILEYLRHSKYLFTSKLSLLLKFLNDSKILSSLCHL